MPAVRLAHELRKANIPTAKMVFALVRVTTAAEIEEAREFIQSAGYQVLEGALLEKPAYRQAQNEGLAVTETRFTSLKTKADQLLQGLVNFLLPN